MVAFMGMNRFVSRLCELMQTSQVTRKTEDLDLDQGAKTAAKAILNAKIRGAMIMLVGNGGSAAVVDHMHNDLVASVGVRAINFFNTPLLTAMSNDYGYENALERPMRIWAEPGGLLIAVSSSGRSENILKCAKLARTRGMTVITFTGFSATNPLRQMGDLNFYVPSDNYGFVETAHSVMTHYISDAAKDLSRTEVHVDEASLPLTSVPE